MDAKTIEYMGQRVDKARDLQEKIRIQNANIAYLKKTNIVLTEVRLGFNSGGAIYIKPSDEILSEISEAMINILTNRLDYLQMELEEI